MQLQLLELAAPILDVFEMLAFVLRFCLRVLWPCCVRLRSVFLCARACVCVLACVKVGVAVVVVCVSALLVSLLL